MPSAILTHKGRLTLPKAIRNLLGLGAGGRVDFIVKDDGTVVLRPAAVDVRDLKGLLQRRGIKRLSIGEMNAVVRRHVTGRARSVSTSRGGQRSRRSSPRRGVDDRQR